MSFVVDSVRSDFPILGRRFNNHPLVYLDNAATTQKPKRVIEMVTRYYTEMNSNVGRAVHFLSVDANQAYERVRAAVQAYINAEKASEIIFTKNTTESINFVAASFGRTVVGPGDQIVLSKMEHHANLLPWQMLCKEKGAHLAFAPLNEREEFDLAAFKALLTDRTKMVAIAHVSNMLGTVTPVREIVEECKKRQIPVLIDGAQAVAHEPVDVRSFGCDFYCFSGHKMYAPMGTGVLYAREERQNNMLPFMGGGGGVMGVTYQEVTKYKPIPFRFEPGTANVGGVLGLGAAIEYINTLGREAIFAHERQLLEHATEKLSKINGMRIVGNARGKSGILSFMREGIHAYDIGAHANDAGMALSTGAHCVMPLMDEMKIVATVRASLGLYNTIDEVDQLADLVASTPKGYWSTEKPNARF